jgi:hypothetical protein
MTETTNVLAFRQPSAVDDPLTDILRAGARDLLARAIEIEVDAFLASTADLTLPDGRARLVRPPKPWPQPSTISPTVTLGRWHLEAREYNDDLAGVWTRGLLIRRNIADSSLAFFSTWCPKGTSIQKLVSVEGHRWAIEDSFETAKNELGLDHNETRSWHGWHRHVSLVMLAFAMMAVIRHRANTAPWLKKRDRGLDRSIVLDPLVDPGNPAHRHEASPAAHPARPHPRMVVLAQGSSGQRAQSPSQEKNATVMLGSTSRPCRW